MKTDAPGPFSCEIYIKSWEIGYRHGSTKLHIENCPFCAPIVHGGTEEFPLSAAEQAKLNIADRKRKARRLFFKKTAVAATLVAASIVGFDQFRNTAESVNPNTMNAAISVDFATLDGAYATLGRGKIESYASHTNHAIANRTLFWIETRGHSNMYDLVCAGLFNQKTEVSDYACHILSRIDPVDLKSHVALIESAMKQSQDSILRAQLSKLLLKIESA